MKRKDIIEELDKESGIDDWKLIDFTLLHSNLYIGRDGKIDNTLESERKEQLVTVYRHFDDTTGEFNFTVGDDLKKQLSDAIDICEYVKNPKYEVPDKTKGYNSRLRLADSRIVRNMKKGNMQRELMKISNRILHHIRHNKAQLNMLELHASSREINIRNSKGVDVDSAATSVYVLLTITKGEQEYVNFFIVSKLDDIKPKEFVEKCTKYVNDISVAVPATSFSGPVILKNRALAEFFRPHLSLSPAVGHASGRLSYMHLSKYVKDEEIVKEWRGEPLTIISNPAIPYTPESNICDDDGVPSKIVTLVDKGKFKNYFASSRYSQYLGVTPTGGIGTIQIGCGKNSSEAICAGDRVEVLEFASFAPNMVSGDFSAEIRLGYLYKGKKKIPFRGGMFTGNVFNLLEDVYFAKESMMKEGYLGPIAVKFMKGVIAGLE
jgi:predicted Zn-dependent protease